MEIELSTLSTRSGASPPPPAASQIPAGTTRRRPVSMEGLEAGSTSAAVTDEDVLRVARICKDIKIGNYLGFLFGIVLIIIVGSTLIIERRNPCSGFLCVPCDTNLPLWAFILLLLQLTLLPMRGVLQMKIPTVTSITTPTEAVERLNRLTKSIWYNITRAFKVFTSIWFLVGMIWAKQSVNCEASKLFYLCFVLIVLFIIIAGFFMLYTIAFLVFRIFSRTATLSMPTFRRVARPGLSQKAIESLPSKRFHPGSIPIDDAICAICLAEYVPGEKIRLLGNCVHHFHSTCIGTWLSTKKNCPLCNAGALKSKLKIKSIPMEMPTPFRSAETPSLPAAGSEDRRGSVRGITEAGQDPKRDSQVAEPPPTVRVAEAAREAANLSPAVDGDRVEGEGEREEDDGTGQLDPATANEVHV